MSKERSMDAQQLKQLQEPHKQRYREFPESGMVELHSQGMVDFHQLTCKVPSRKDPSEDGVVAGLHPAAGGPGTFACSGEMLLDALIACAGVTFAAVSTAMSLSISEAMIVAKGWMDFRGTLGVDKTVPVGIQRIELQFEVHTSASDEQLATLLRLTERYCVIMQTLQQSTAIVATIVRRGNAPQIDA
ncbi:MAG: OsmC family protein [Pirellulales bacterium]